MNKDSFPSTHLSLMTPLLEGSPERQLVALGCFYERYRAALRQVLEARLMLHPLDADSILHDFLCERIADGSLIQRYIECIKTPQSRHRKFRHYLSKSIYHFAIDWIRRSRPTMSLDELQPLLPSVEPDLNALFQMEWIQGLLVTVLQRTREYYVGRGVPWQWEIFLERWIKPAFSGSEPPTHQALAEKHDLPRVKQVGTVLTNVLRAFRRIWDDVLAEELGTHEKAIHLQAMNDAFQGMHMAKYLDSRRLLLQCFQRFDSQETQTIGGDQLASLLALAAQGFDGLLTSEQESLLDFYLDLPITECLLFNADMSSSALDAIGTTTFAELLASATPDIRVLTAVNRLCQDNIRDPDAPIPKPIASTLRFATLALATERCRQQLSSAPTHKLLEGIEQVLRFRWLRPQLRELLAGFAASLRSRA